MERRRFIRNLGIASMSTLIPLEAFSYLMREDDEIITHLERIMDRPLKKDFELAQNAITEKFPRALGPNYYTEYLRSQLPEIKRILASENREIEESIKRFIPEFIDTAKAIHEEGIEDLTSHPQYEKHYKNMKHIAKLFHKAGNSDLKQAIRELKKETKPYKGFSVPEIMEKIEQNKKLQ